jgi:hypothetical protein
LEISEILQRVDELKALLLYGVTAQGKPLKDALDIKGHHEA